MAGVARASLHREHVDDGEGGEEHLHRRLDELGDAPIPRSALQEQPVDVHAFLHTHTATMVGQLERQKRSQ